MPIIVTFTNNYGSKHLSLGALDTRSGKFAWLVNDDNRDAFADSRGISGIIRFRDHWVVGGYIPGNRLMEPDLEEGAVPGRLAFLDDDFKLVRIITVPGMYWLHSLCELNGRLYTANTGTDEVLEIEIDDNFNATTRPFHRMSPTRYDHHHLNSVAVHDNRLLCTTFGPKHEDGWGKSTQGRLFRPDTGETVLAPLHNPHTAFSLSDGRWACCESKANKVHFSDGSEVQLEGYTRGLTQARRNLYVGLSGRRLQSRSTGRMMHTSVTASNLPAVAVVDLDSNEVTRVFSLKHFATEIYDLYYVPSSALPKKLFEQDAVAIRMRQLETDLMERSQKAEQAWVTPRLRKTAADTAQRLGLYGPARAAYRSLRRVAERVKG